MYKNNIGIQTCTQCVIDSTDSDIIFDSRGVCNHCIEFQTNVNNRIFKGDEAERELAKLVAKIKSKGKNREYDCIIGVSGGVDSTYLAYLTHQLGLRPLAIHFDNGWNSELAVANIEKILNKLSIDLYTHVVDWEEFRDLQLSFLKASTPDCEIPTDHGIYALLLKEAAKRGIHYILKGTNYATEGILMPVHWSYGHSDWTYIKAVHKKFGSAKLSTFPHYSLLYAFWVLFIKRVKVVSILNYINYDKNEALKIIQEQLGWVDYGGKHHESIYTRFYQSYILPKKFNIDKRKVHLSDSINSKQLTRSKAVEILKTPIGDEQLVESDKEFVIKKFGVTEQYFDDIMALPIKKFSDYPNNYNLIKFTKSIFTHLKKIRLIDR